MNPCKEYSCPQKKARRKKLTFQQLVAIPFLQSAATLLNKYRSRPSFIPGRPVFPKITNQEVNRCLKIIQAVCGIEFPLTFHIARHTFAKTVALKSGIPLETVQIMLGHTKITTTQIYADVDEEKLLDDTAGREEKLDKKREIALAARQLHGSQTSIS